MKSNYYLQFNKVTALFLGMKEFEKSNVVRQGSPFNSALVFTFTAFSSSAVSETCISRWTTQFSFFIYFTSKFLFFLKLWPKGQNNRRNAVPDDVRRAGEEIKCLKMMVLSHCCPCPKFWIDEYAFMFDRICLLRPWKVQSQCLFAGGIKFPHLSVQIAKI